MFYTQLTTRCGMVFTNNNQPLSKVLKSVRRLLRNGRIVRLGDTLVVENLDNGNQLIITKQ